MALSDVSEGLRENNISLQEIKEEIVNLQGKLSSSGGGGFNLPKFTNPMKMIGNLADSLIKNNPVSKAIRGVKKSMKGIGDSIKAPFKAMSKLFGNMFEMMKSPNFDGLIDKLIPALKPLFEPIYKLLGPNLDDLEASREAKEQKILSENDGDVDPPKKSFLGKLGIIGLLKSFAKFIPIGLGVLLSGEALQLILKSVKESLGFDANFSILDAINNKAEALFGMPLFGETTTNALKAIGEAFAEGGFIAGIKETVTKMSENLPSLTTALESMTTMWESTKTFFEDVVQKLGLGPLRDKITEFIGKDLGIAEIIALTVGIAALSKVIGGPKGLVNLALLPLKGAIGLLKGAIVALQTFMSFKQLRRLKKNTTALAALTAAILKNGMGGFDIDGKKRSRSKYPAGTKINGKAVGGQFMSDAAMDAAEQGKSKLGKLGRFKNLLKGFTGIPVAGTAIALGLAAVDSFVGGFDALSKFKPTTLTDSIEVGIVGAAAGVTSGFAGLVDMGAGLFGVNSDLAGGVISLRDSFLNWSLDTKEKVEDMSDATSSLPTDRELRQAAIKNKHLVLTNQVPHPSGSIPVNNRAAEEIAALQRLSKSGLIDSIQSPPVIINNGGNQSKSDVTILNSQDLDSEDRRDYLQGLWIRQ